MLVALLMLFGLLLVIFMLFGLTLQLMVIFGLFRPLLVRSLGSCVGSSFYAAHRPYGGELAVGPRPTEEE